MRHERRRFRKDLAQIFDDNRRIDDHPTVVNQARHDSVRIDLQILGAKLIPGEQVEFELGERKSLLVESKANSLAAGGLRRIV